MAYCNSFISKNACRKKSNYFLSWFWYFQKFCIAVPLMMEINLLQHSSKKLSFQNKLEYLEEKFLVPFPVSFSDIFSELLFRLWALWEQEPIYLCSVNSIVNMHMNIWNFYWTIYIMHRITSPCAGTFWSGGAFHHMISHLKSDVVQPKHTFTASVTIRSLLMWYPWH